ncbi:hypothetical protein EVAR_17232_1 [Eumeta japonica]|uniref:Uncharacterized protein n=1 Tax=Eumeta variegata TaxID=151549 RepID=A0A4C1U9A1_EUMVA|nr:hypothetical protein EVAR_17232_1 [Eumeta japonica]
MLITLDESSITQPTKILSRQPTTFRTGLINKARGASGIAPEPGTPLRDCAGIRAALSARRWEITVYKRPDCRGSRLNNANSMGSGPDPLSRFRVKPGYIIAEARRIRETMTV